LPAIAAGAQVVEGLGLALDVTGLAKADQSARVAVHRRLVLPQALVRPAHAVPGVGLGVGVADLLRLA
jgi:hypothetical protein